MISSLSLAGILALFAWYEEPLKFLTLKYMPSIKLAYGDTFQEFNTLVNFFSHIEFYYFITLSIYAIRCNREESFEGLLVLNGLIVINESLKMIYERPRPFMLEELGKGAVGSKCPMEYGAPSGHSMIGAGMSIYWAIKYGAGKVKWISLSTLFALI